MTIDAASFFHPLMALLGLAAAGADSTARVHAHPGTLLGWDALRGTPLAGSIWMVRDRWMAGHDARGPLTALPSLLRC